MVHRKGSIPFQSTLACDLDGRLEAKDINRTESLNGETILYTISIIVQSYKRTPQSNRRQYRIV